MYSSYLLDFFMHVCANMTENRSAGKTLTSYKYNININIISEQTYLQSVQLLELLC